MFSVVVCCEVTSRPLKVKGHMAVQTVKSGFSHMMGKKKRKNGGFGLLG